MNLMNRFCSKIFTKFILTPFSWQNCRRYGLLCGSKLAIVVVVVVVDDDDDDDEEEEDEEPSE